MIELDALPDVRFEGYVSRMVPTVDRTKATVMTKIRFRELRPAHPARHEREGGVPVEAADGRESTQPRPAVDAQAVVEARRA